MLCKNCGCENPDEANFCLNCGSDLKVFMCANENIETLQSQSLINHKKRLKLIKSIDKSKILMLVSLIFSISVYIPYINLFTSLFAFILTIVSMTLTVNVIKKLDSYDLPWQKALNITRRLRFNYVIALLAVLLAIIITVAFVDDVQAISNYGEDPIKILILLIAIFVYILLFFYNLAIHIWCLIRWFYIKEFLTIAKLEVMRMATEDKKINSVNCDC